MEEIKTEEIKEEPKTESAPEVKEETPVQSPQVTEELLAKMVNLCESQSETITDLKTRLNELEEKHQDLRTEYQNDKPLDVRAEVMGFYDFSKQKEIAMTKSYNNDKQYARDLLSKLQTMYPSV